MYFITENSRWKSKFWNTVYILKRLTDNKWYLINESCISKNDFNKGLSKEEMSKFLWLNYKPYKEEQKNRLKI